MTPPRSKIVCECLQVTEAELLKAIRRHEITSLTDICAYTSAGEGCTACHPLLKGYLEKEKKKGATSPPPPRPAAPKDSSQSLSL